MEPEESPAGDVSAETTHYDLLFVSGGVTLGMLVNTMDTPTTYYD